MPETSLEWCQRGNMHTNRIAAILTIVLLSGLNSLASKDVLKDCPVTKPNGSMPAGEPQSGKCAGCYGNGALWTVLWPEGKVVFRPGGSGFVEPDGSLSMKFPWWRAGRAGYGKFTIEGRRLDEPGPPLRAYIPDGYTNAQGYSGFQATALIFPTEGCWEVTGRAGQDSLTFVTQVVRVSEHK
jgi:hypothetical protein